MGIFDDIGNALDPNKNGVANAFDPNRNGVANAFDPSRNGVNNFFNNDVRNGLENFGNRVLPLVTAPLQILGRLPVVGPLLSPLINLIPGLGTPRPGPGPAPGPGTGTGTGAPDMTLLIGGGLLALLLLS